MQRRRESRFELLRIVAMLMIIAQHAIERGSGTDEWSILRGGWNSSFIPASLLGSWGQIGVILFVIITSWFTVDRQGIKSVKAVTIALQAWITSLLIVLIMLLIPSLPSPSLRTVIVELMTPFYQQYWFVTTFLFFYMILPLLQKLVGQMDAKTLGLICLLLTPLIPLYNYFWQNVGGSLADFIYIFLLTGYLKRKEGNWFETHRHLAAIGILILEGMIIALKLIFTYVIPGHDNGFIMLYQNLRGRTFISIGVSFLIFYCFKNYHIEYQKWINVIGKATFGVYLLHENMLFRVVDGHRSLLWAGLFHIDWWYQNSTFAWTIHVLATVTVLIVCVPISLLLENLAEKIMLKPVRGICIKIDSEYMKIFN